jgi:5-hydroxyisourate hydrolase
MSQVVVFVMDTARGEVARDLPVELERLLEDQTWLKVATGFCDDTGCIEKFMPGRQNLPAGTYRLRYLVNDYFLQHAASSVFPEIVVNFNLAENERLVLPLLLSPHGYSTYRGG